MLCYANLNARAYAKASPQTTPDRTLILEHRKNTDWPIMGL